MGPKRPGNFHNKCCKRIYFKQRQSTIVTSLDNTQLLDYDTMHVSKQ
uniref:Uncharacterized protein n=1 Tax=Arundo donax TaxID=35708 RepID=A0A0A9FPN1_ARUDO